MKEIEIITADELMKKEFPKRRTFDTMIHECIEVPDYVEKMSLNFDNVEVIFEFGMGFMIVMNSGVCYFVNYELKERIVKRLEGSNGKS